MEYYVGLDVSLKQTSICVVDRTGSVVREGVVDSDPEAISVYVRSKAPDAVRIGLETGPTSTWLWTELKRLGRLLHAVQKQRHALQAADRMFGGDVRVAPARLVLGIGNADERERHPILIREREHGLTEAFLRRLAGNTPLDETVSPVTD
jgi:hypothetical protein